MHDASVIIKEFSVGINSPIFERWITMYKIFRGIEVFRMAKKGAKRRKLKEIKEQGKLLEQEKNGQVKSKKKDGKHVLDKMKFESGAQEKIYNHLAAEFLTSHLPKVMDIVPTEVREKRGDNTKVPGKLFDEYIKTISTKKTYVKRIKTFIKWNVINKGINRLGDIDEKSTTDFFQLLAANIGTSKDKYSTKTFDSYLDGVHKYFHAVYTAPGDAKTKIEGKSFGGRIKSAEGLKNREFRDELRGMSPNYSSADYKRGKKDGYSSRDARVISKKSETLDIEKQLIVAILVMTGARNEELRNTTLDCFDKSNRNFRMLNPHMNKQNRPRVVVDVDEKLFDLVEKYKEVSDVVPNTKIFEKYTEDDVREIIRECCSAGKIGYSGVHDLRKSYLEIEEKKMMKSVLKGELNKEQIVDKIMNQVNIDERLNPLVPKTDWVSKYKKGKRAGYRRKIIKPIEMVRKFDKEELMKTNIENLVDLYIAEQLGHNKIDTNMEYRGELQREFRREFRKEMRKRK